jgi:hypothetical protein
VHHRSEGVTRKAKPSDDIFCAKRAWDKRSETLGKKIEDVFQSVAERIITGGLRNFGRTEKEITDRFFALWRARVSLRDRDPADVPLNGVLPGEDFTKDEEEILEKSGMSFARRSDAGHGVVVPSRFVNGATLLGILRKEMSQLRGLNWTVLCACDGQFLAPDSPDHGVIPLSPQLLLYTTGEYCSFRHSLERPKVVAITSNS